MTEALVSTQWVEDNLGKTDVIRLIEVSVDTSLYAEGHIPGAVEFNWETQLQDQVNRDILSETAFEALLSAAGITPETHVVIYGDKSNWFAAYALWLFNYYGHEKISLIDGGKVKWTAEERPLTQEVPTFSPTTYKVTNPNLQYRTNRDHILGKLGTDEFGLVDVRSVPEFVGDIIAPPGMTETAQRAGHIPGALNVPWATAVNEDGTFKSAEELAKIYAGGVDKNEVITYCRIGERSSHTWFVLKHILGHENVRNYDGSWTEWGNLIGNPIEKGEAG